MDELEQWIEQYENNNLGDTSAGPKNYTKQPISQIKKHSVDLLSSENVKSGDTSAGSKNSTKQPMYPISLIQKQPTDEWIDEWIKRYENLSREHIYAGSTKQPICPTSQIQKQSIDLKVSLQMFLQEATSFADQWKDVNRKYDDRRSFPTFLRKLQMLGMDWHKYMSEDSDINVSNQPNRWLSLQAPSDAVVQLFQETGPNSDWVVATKYYNRSLSLIQLLQRIHLESCDDFKRKQAGLLGSFLGHLIMLQQEQQVVAYNFSKHLEQLRKCDAAASLTFSTNAVDDDGDRDKCPFILFKHTGDLYMWQAKHQFDSLYTISRESTWLLKKLEESRFSSPSFVKESHKVLEKIVGFTSKFQKSKELLEQYLSDDFTGYPFINDDMVQLALEHKEILKHFRNNIKDLQEEDVGNGSVIEILLGSLIDVCKIPVIDYSEKINSNYFYAEFFKAVTATMKMISEAREKLNSARFSTLVGGSPLGNITLWRIIFESALVDIRLDLISKTHGEAIKFGVKELIRPKHVSQSRRLHGHLDALHAAVSLLLSDGNRVLLDFLAMHKTMAKISYMLGDAFATGGAGMNELNDEASHECSSKNGEAETKMNFDIDFPWDKHNILDEVEIDLEDPNRLVGYPCDSYGPDDFDFVFT